MALTDLYNAADAMIEGGDEVVEGVIEPDILTADDIEGELSLEVESAVSFMHSELAPQWERAQRYYNGETDLPTQKGRSRIVSTQVRDAIRAARPSLLRIFLHADTIVEFLPSHTIHGALAHQQSVYANQLFFRSGRGELEANPFIFVRGDWTSIYERRKRIELTLVYDEDGRYLKSTVYD